MVDVMGAIGDRTGISSFYISFVLAPLASNASELIAAFNYSLKKTSRTIVISFSALQVRGRLGACLPGKHMEMPDLTSSSQCFPKIACMTMSRFRVFTAFRARKEKPVFRARLQLQQLSISHGLPEKSSHVYFRG